MDKRVTLYRKAEDWKALYLEGVSLTYGQSRMLRDSRDKTRRHRADTGVQTEKVAEVKIPKEVLDKNTSLDVGDILLLGKGPKQLSSPSQPRKEGWEYFVVQQVEDRLGDAVLPHLRLKCV